MKTAIFLHIYYTDIWQEIISKIKSLDLQNTSYYINVSDSINSDNIISEIKSELPNAVVINSPNKGKDIGGKLLLLNYYLKASDKSDTMLFLHDKKSPQAVNGDEWRKKLLKICNKDCLVEIKNHFEKPKTAIVSSKDAIIMNNKDNENIIFAAGKDLIFELRNKFAINNDDLSFVGGSMFWIRSEIFESFFSKHNIIEIYKTLEEGNILDDLQSSYTHAWERMLSWIATNDNREIKGI